MIKASANRDFDLAILLTNKYIEQVEKELINAEESIESVKQLLSGCEQSNTQYLKRKEVSKALDISMDTLRNWEMNGLLSVKRKENGYRIYTDSDMRRLKVIRALRCANYSLEAILRLLRQLSQNPDIDIRDTLNNPRPSDDIISVCDRLIVSLTAAKKNAYEIRVMLQDMKNKYL